MTNLLNDDEVLRIQETAEVLAVTLQTIGENWPPYAVVLQDAACRSLVNGLRELAERVDETDPVLASVIKGTVLEIESIIEGADDA